MATLLTLIVCVESRGLPWSPFFLIYAVLAIAMPLLLGGWSLGSPATLWSDHGIPIAGAAGAMLIWELGAATWFYERVLLGRLGRAGDPRWSPTHALEHLTEEAGRRTSLAPRTTQAIFGAYSLLWAPVAEELFYWGYLFGNLRAGMSFWAAAAVTSGFFGIRHATHFLYLGRRFPWPAAAWLAFSTGVTGLINSWLYEETDALLPLIAIHLAANLLFAVYGAVATEPK